MQPSINECIKHRKLTALLQCNKRSILKMESEIYRIVVLNMKYINTTIRIFDTIVRYSNVHIVYFCAIKFNYPFNYQ
jgi:hypothetical protein